LGAILFAGPADLGSQELVQEQVAVPMAGALSSQDQAAVQAKLGGGSGRLAGMVGLGRASGDDGISSLLQSIGHQELQLASLVAAGDQAGLIVALDEETRPTQGFAQMGHFLQGGGQVGDRNTRQVLGQHDSHPPS
jgi:hypothetical protein